MSRGPLQHPQQMPLAQLVSIVGRFCADRLRVKLEKIGLHRGQGFVLMHLWHHNGVAQGELADAKHVRPATITNILKRMERDGWIERRRDAHDERVVRVYLTEKGMALHDEAQATFLEVDEEIATALTGQERDTFRHLLMKLHARLVPACIHGSRESTADPTCHGTQETGGDTR